MVDISANSNSNADKPIRIAFHENGENTPSLEPHAVGLYSLINTELPGKVQFPQKTDERRAPLGTEEIVITIILTSLSKAAITTALNIIENYLTEKVKAQQKLRGQIVVKEETDELPKRHLFNTNLELAALTTVINTIRELTAKL